MKCCFGLGLHCLHVSASPEIPQVLPHLPHAVAGSLLFGRLIFLCISRSLRFDEVLHSLPSTTICQVHYKPKRHRNGIKQELRELSNSSYIYIFTHIIYMHEAA